MKNLSPKVNPAFDSDGYQLGAHTGEPTDAAMARLRTLTPEEVAALGLPSPAQAAEAKVIVRHGGARTGSGRKPTGKLAKRVKLSPAAITRLQAWQKRKGLKTFSAAVEAASELV